MTFAYYGGWLTPFVEALNLHHMGPKLKWLLNRFYFPADDAHRIEVILARKISQKRDSHSAAQMVTST